MRASSFSGARPTAPVPVDAPDEAAAADRSRLQRRGRTLYEQVGGHEALSAAVTVFYQRVLADPDLRPWFDGVDLRRLASHQRAFLAAALGGPDLFAGRDLAGAHAGLGVTSEAFDAVVDHLACTLRDLGVDTDVVARVGEHVEALRPEVVEPDAGRRRPARPPGSVAVRAGLSGGEPDGEPLEAESRRG